MFYPVCTIIGFNSQFLREITGYRMVFLKLKFALVVGKGLISFPRSCFSVPNLLVNV